MIKFESEMRKAMVIQERINRTAKYMEQGDTPHQARLKAIADMEAISGKEQHEKNM